MMLIDVLSVLKNTHAVVMHAQVILDEDQKRECAYPEESSYHGLFVGKVEVQVVLASCSFVFQLDYVPDCVQLETVHDDDVHCSFERHRCLILNFK